MKDVLTRIAWKNHQNGALNPRAQFRKEVVQGDHLQRRPWSPATSGIFDCSGVSRRLGRRHHLPGRGRPPLHRQPAVREGAVVRRRSRRPAPSTRLRLHHLPRGGPLAPPTPTGRPASTTPGPSWPWPRSTTASRRPSWCSWRTSASPSGAWRWKEVLAGTFDLDGELAVNPDGGLKSFGHPIGASGLRMLFECWLQLRGEAGRAPDLQRQEAGPDPQPRWRARASASASSASSAASRRPDRGSRPNGSGAQVADARQTAGATLCGAARQQARVRGGRPSMAILGREFIAVPDDRKRSDRVQVAGSQHPQDRPRPSSTPTRWRCSSTPARWRPPWGPAATRSTPRRSPASAPSSTGRRGETPTGPSCSSSVPGSTPGSRSAGASTTSRTPRRG